MQAHFKADLRDAEFVLWEQLQVARTVLGQAGQAAFDEAGLRALTIQAADFASQVLGPLHAVGDTQGCRAEGSRINAPPGFAAAWQQYTAAGWSNLGVPARLGGGGVPYVNVVAMQELFAGANLAFVTYGAFAFGALILVRKYGDADLQAMFCDKLASNRWNACLCMTEPQAGTDLGAIQTRASPVAGNLYRIQGRKALISAGSDELVDNQVYLLLARTADAPHGTQGVSCFLVPKYRIAASGDAAGDNGVRVLRLEDKMGLRGSATAELSFGEAAECHGYLLGGQAHQGLSQLLTTMNQARVSTGLFGLGVASAAYRQAAQHASQRLQGVDLRELLNPAAEKVPLAAHADVRRMLMEMKCKVEGCRALIYRVALHHTQHLMALSGDAVLDADTQARNEALVSLLAPVIKAYTTDEAWRICELGIQVLGGRGYTRDFPLEQYARDVKVLSIWEGTNYVQAADLLVSRIGLGKGSPLLKAFAAEVSALLEQALPDELQGLQARLRAALKALHDSHALLARLMQARRMDLVLLNATRFLRMVAQVALGWLLLEAAQIATARLATLAPDDPERPFYQGKVHSARFYFANFVSTVAEDAARIAEEDSSALDLDAQLFQDTPRYEDFTI